MDDHKRLSETNIIFELAHQAAKGVTRRVRRDLQKMKDGLLSGDDSGLRNAWDEICVQAQTEESYAWEAYEDTITGFIEGYVKKLPEYEQEALWLQTPEGSSWDSEDDHEDPYPVNESDISHYLLQEYLLNEAVNWENPRIRASVDRFSVRD